MFEAVEFVDKQGEFVSVERLLGEFESEASAVEAARAAKKSYQPESSKDYAWWIVRKKGARLAEFIADSTSNKEFVLDLSSGELVEVELDR